MGRARDSLLAGLASVPGVSAAAPDGASERLHDGIEGGALAMDAWLFRPAGACRAS